MKPDISLPHLQQPATCPYTKPAQSSSCLHFTSLRSILVLSSLLSLGLSSCLLPSGLLTKILYAHKNLNEPSGFVKGRKFLPAARLL
jgi:hypothetical protein